MATKATLFPPLELFNPTFEFECFGKYICGKLECEAECKVRGKCKLVTGDNIRHADTSGIHAHICEVCGKEFQHFNHDVHVKLLCRKCLEKHYAEM